MNTVHTRTAVASQETHAVPSLPQAGAGSMARQRVRVCGGLFAAQLLLSLCCAVGQIAFADDPTHGAVGAALQAADAATPNTPMAKALGS